MSDKSDTTKAIPRHLVQVGDILRWESGQIPNNIHRWRVHSICLGGIGQESIIEMESLTHTPGHGAEFDMPLAIVAVPEVLIRHLAIEDVGDQFGVPSSRRGAQ